MQPFFMRWIVTTLAVMVVSWVFPNLLSVQGTSALLGGSLLLGIVNALIRPFLLLLSLPFIIATMGLFIFVVNALLLLLVSSMVREFHVDGFWHAFFASIFISIVSWPLSSFFRTSDGRVRPITHHERMKRANARVIE
ncbi:MAG: phage holin family protein [Chthoniobacterales bacterium]